MTLDNAPNPDHAPSAILFDMDGTLTEPMLDFDTIRREMGLPTGRPILEAMELLPPPRQVEAWNVLQRHEAHAARHAALNPGCKDVLAELESRRIPVALVTRNSRQSVNLVLETHGLKIDVLIAREDAAPKPSPEPLHLACSRLGVSSAETWMVGDGMFDVQAGLAAGVRTVWLSHGQPRRFPETPWHEIVQLRELMMLIAHGAGWRRVNGD